MLLKIDINEKVIGGKLLYQNLNLTISENQKLGLIGRNGTGKTTLLNLIAGIDKDFDGQIEISARARLAFTRQEHTTLQNLNLIQYILEDLPEYKILKSKMDSFAKLKSPSNTQLQNYSDALERFTILGYFEVEERIKEDLRRLQLSEELISGTLSSLSGGQKRLAEVVKIMNSSANLVLMDEPTNHMDYIAKKWFCEWLKNFQGSVLVITHDRDVLNTLNGIIEIKDLSAIKFSGGYNSYLTQNTISASSNAAEYENAQKRIERLKIQIRQAVIRKLQAPPDQAKKWKTLENRLRKEHDELQENLQKPSLWIDKESTSNLRKEDLAKYDKYKAKNINIQTSASSHGNLSLVKVEDLSLGYAQNILFKDLNFSISTGDKIEIRGRNGAGKTTLVKAILDSGPKSNSDFTKLNFPDIRYFAGLIEVSPQLSIGLYEQELSADYLSLSLESAVEKFYLDCNLKVSEQKIRSVLSNYLFEAQDLKTKVLNLSGGQKARLQLIKMFINEPNLLILDEPTNHLDLPSIEELEVALQNYSGAILYISHDSYFQKALGGEVIQI
jgi:ATPase subunit of ABC transporter with duplicated ATPase domains